MFNIVLHEPRIPGNVGTIGRLCFALNCKLHLIKPYGFADITKKEVRRAGLDYWYDLEVYEYKNIEDFWQKNIFSPRHFFSTTKTKQIYFEKEFQAGDYFYFGREDAGLPQNILNKDQDSCVSIPMTNSARSLNMANCVSIIVYEALRQNFANFVIK